MKSVAFTVTAVLFAYACGAFAQSAPETKPTPEAATTVPSAPASAAVDQGEHVFAVHCSRCHNAPEQLDPRMTGAVLRHMRVRATLSVADERALLRFFNP